MTNKIPCPNCQTLVPFNSEELLKGTTFTCSNCRSILGLDNELSKKQEYLEVLKNVIKGKDSTPIE